MAERKNRKGAAVASGAALALGALAAGRPADAATFNVTNLNDAGAGSLRQAILDANGTAGADTVTFQAGLTGTIALTSGDLDIQDSLDIQGPGAAVLAVSGNNASRVFSLYLFRGDIDVTISGLTITGGNAIHGGGIFVRSQHLTLDAVTITGNTATFGAGLFIEEPRVIPAFPDKGTGAEALVIQDTTISGNHATDAGGGILIANTLDGAHSIRGTTISGNSAARGGGVFAFGLALPLSLENSTISGNQATAGNGGGIYLFYMYNQDTSGIELEMEHVTVAGNSASGTGGGIFTQTPGGVGLSNTIVGDNTAAGAGNDLANGPDGDFTAVFSLIENPGAANFVSSANSIFFEDPQLGPLQNNGGPTLTHLPAFTSPVVDAGANGLTTDQRGLTRPVGPAVDLGSVEFRQTTIEIPTLGDVGKVLLGGLVGLAGFLLLRRR